MLAMAAPACSLSPAADPTVVPAARVLNMDSGGGAGRWNLSPPCCPGAGESTPGGLCAGSGIRERGPNSKRSGSVPGVSTGSLPCANRHTAPAWSAPSQRHAGGCPRGSPGARREPELRGTRARWPPPTGVQGVCRQEGECHCQRHGPCVPTTVTPPLRKTSTLSIPECPASAWRPGRRLPPTLAVGPSVRPGAPGSAARGRLSGSGGGAEPRRTGTPGS